MGSLRRRATALISLVFAIAACACASFSGGLESNPTVGLSPATPTAVPPTAVPTPPIELSLVAVGDIMLARSVGSRITSDGPAVVFGDELSSLLRSADITLGNLETSISERGEAQWKSYTFRAPPASARALGEGGFDVVSLANNHSLDYGADALADTISSLEGAGVLAVGAGAEVAEAAAPVVLERGGLRIAVVALVDTPAEGSFGRPTWEALAARPGVAWADAETVVAAVSAATRQADIVVLLLHFGNEYESTPSAGQRALARAAVEAGAAVVIGSHPHVLQEVERYRGGLIAYSLGNFVFDGFDGAANSTAVLRVRLAKAGVIDWELVPATIGADGLPRLDAGQQP